MAKRMTLAGFDDGGGFSPGVVRRDNAAERKGGGGAGRLRCWVSGDPGGSMQQQPGPGETLWGPYSRMTGEWKEGEEEAVRECGSNVFRY